MENLPEKFLQRGDKKIYIFKMGMGEDEKAIPLDMLKI